MSLDRLAPDLKRLSRLRVRKRKNGLIADVANAINRRSESASADGKIHRAIFANNDVGQRQTVSAQELLHLRAIAGSGWLEENGVDRCKRPVADK